MQTITIEQFGALDLVNDPAETSGAVDLLNVDLDLRGRLRTRNGLTRFSTSAPRTYTKLIPGFPVGAYPFLLLWSNAGTFTLDQVDTAGVVTTLGALGAVAVTSSTVLGTPSVTYLYLAQGNVAVSKYDGTTLSPSTGKCYYVAATPWDNRLMQARFLTASDKPAGQSANASPSTVYFSKAGDPEDFSTEPNNHIHLHPGDGEAISGCAAWRDLVFVTKRTKLFAFDGVSPGATGAPIFNYRALSVPQRVRLLSTNDSSIVAGSDGAYFVTADGVYRTSGGEPRCVSQAIAPMFTGAGSPALQISSIEGLDWVGERLYLRFTATDTARYTLVYDRLLNEWMWWSNAVIGYAEWPGPTATNRPTLYGLRSNYVVHESTATTDDGAAIASHYQSGWSDLGTPNEKRIRELAAWGSGSPTLALFADRSTVDASAAAVPLGAAPAVARSVQSKTRVGRELSWKVSATSGAWSLSRLELAIADQRVS